MNKLLKRILIVVASIIIILIIGYRGLIMYTKSFSPEQRATFTEGPLRIEVDYSSPGKKDREIFGALVPFGQVWRTGANYFHYLGRPHHRWQNAPCRKLHTIHHSRT